MVNINKTLLEFQRNVELDSNLYFKKASEEQEIFVRDQIGCNLLHTTVFVVSTHRSKSCLLPVYGFYLANGMCIHMRENFYGWVVSVDSLFEFSLPSDLVYGDGENHDGDIYPGYCEGFKDEWCYPYTVSNTKRSTFRVNTDFNLYTVFYHLNKLGNPLTFPDMTDNEIIEAIADMVRNHSDDDIYGMLIRTYRIADNLGILMPLANDDEDIAKIIIEHPEIRQAFIKEYNIFHMGETMEANSTKWIDEYF